jgi:hypothetical protein
MDNEKELMQEGEAEVQDMPSFDPAKAAIATAIMIQALVSKVVQLEREVAKHCDFLEDKLPKHAKMMLEEQQKGQKMGKVAELRGKYPQFSDYEEPFEAGKKESGEELPPIYEQIYDILENLKLDAGFSPDKEKAEVDKLLEEFKGRFPKEAPKVEAATEPTKMSEGGEMKTPEDRSETIKRQIDELDKRRKAKGIKDDRYI